MKNVLVQAGTLSTSTCPVLIQGETGTGKELIARFIHGGRGPFVVVDCTHLSPHLAEAELFGHVRGAYTSADSERTGLMEAADGGVAFFDEIGELSLEVQAKLLRLLQHKTFRRVGSTRERRSEFRVVAASNRDLKREVEARRFREDLYYRLNVAKIRIPPLRNRKEDIPVLVEHFMEPLGMKPNPEILRVLQAYNWPGNVRELENCIHRMVVQSSGGELGPEHIPQTIHTELLEHVPEVLPFQKAGPGNDSEKCGMLNRHAPDVRGDQKRAGPVSIDIPEPLPMPRRQLESLNIFRALRESGGDRDVAAHLLEMSRSTLYRKLREMQNDPQLQLLLQQLRSK
jgi:DNA-binding NtrC family response regulator